MTADPNLDLPILGCIADDVTGATDLATNLVQGGFRVVQVLGVPDDDLIEQLVGVDAVVVALKSRSIPKADAIQLSLDALTKLQRCGAERFYFKYCSTFDSTADGNIGPVGEALMERLDVEQLIFCPAFPQAGRTVYQGHLFVGDRLLSESGMQNHPINPMTDSDLVRFLSLQTSRPVGCVDANVYSRGVSAVAERLSELASDGFKLVVTDALDDVHLQVLARSISSMPLITGGSGLARYLAAVHTGINHGDEVPFPPKLPVVEGRSLIVAGSCSLATNAQVDFMTKRCPIWRVDIGNVLNDSRTERTLVTEWAKGLKADEPMLIASTSPAEQVAEYQKQYGAKEVAVAIEEFLASITSALVDDLNVRRLVLAGGETSGAIVDRLGIRSLRIGPEICTGVPWTETVGREPALALALKSGNFGSEDFFQAALEMLP